MPLTSVSSVQLLTVPSQSGFGRTTFLPKQSSLRQRSHSQSSFLFHQPSMFEKAKKYPLLQTPSKAKRTISSHVQSSKKPSLVLFSSARQKYEKLNIKQQLLGVGHYQPKAKRQKSERFLEIFHEMEEADKGKSLLSMHFDPFESRVDLEEELKRKIEHELKSKFDYELAEKSKQVTEELRRSEKLRRQKQKQVQVEVAWTQTDPPPMFSEFSRKTPSPIDTVPQLKTEIKQTRQKSVEKNEKKVELEKTITPAQPIRKPMQKVQQTLKSAAVPLKAKAPKQNEDDGLEVVNLVESKKQASNIRQEVPKKEETRVNMSGKAAETEKREAYAKISEVINKCNLLLQIGETAAFCAQNLKKRRTDWRNSVILLYRYCYDSLKEFEAAHYQAHHQQVLSQKELNNFIEQNTAIREMLSKILKAFDKKNRLNQAYRSYIVSEENTKAAIFPLLLQEVGVFLKSMAQEKEDSEPELVICGLRVINSMLIIFKMIKPEVEIVNDIGQLSEAEATKIFPVWKQKYLEWMRKI